MGDNDFINSFLARFYSSRPQDITQEEMNVIQSIVDDVAREFQKRKYVLGLALDFILLAQALDAESNILSSFRPSYMLQDITSDFEPVRTRGDSKANTFSVIYNGRQFGIRRFEEDVADFFHAADRSEYPSAYVYNTGQWTKYTSLLERSFKLSYSGRFIATELLIKFGFSEMEKNIYFDRANYRCNLFEKIIEQYPRGDQDENGGLIFQAIAFGFIIADRPHLHVIADKVRTGSSRQKRIGDIDCYQGLDLEFTIEVKDFELNERNFERQVGEFIRNAERKKTNSAIICSSYNLDEIERFETYNTIIIDQDDIVFITSTWDYRKQELAVSAMLHYLAHIEQNSKATTRLLGFIKEKDPKNKWLEFDT